MECKLGIEIHSHWSEKPPTYRLYVNEELFTERVFAYPSYQCFIKEILFCDLTTGIHYLTLENCDLLAKFELANFELNGQPVNKNFLKNKDTRLEWAFTIDSILAKAITKKK